jgi:hypothetical protein
MCCNFTNNFLQTIANNYLDQRRLWDFGLWNAWKYFWLHIHTCFNLNLEFGISAGIEIAAKAAIVTLIDAKSQRKYVPKFDLA